MSVSSVCPTFFTYIYIHIYFSFVSLFLFSLHLSEHVVYICRYMSDNNLYMLLEYFPLQSVDQLLEQNKGLMNIMNEKTVRFYAACIFRGIAHMHEVEMFTCCL
jgi:serine/threonine protein kinase